MVVCNDGADDVVGEPPAVQVASGSGRRPSADDDAAGARRLFLDGRERGVHELALDARLGETRPDEGVAGSAVDECHGTQSREALVVDEPGATKSLKCVQPVVLGEATGPEVLGDLARGAISVAQRAQCALDGLVGHGLSFSGTPLEAVSALDGDGLLDLDLHRLLGVRL